MPSLSAPASPALIFAVDTSSSQGSVALFRGDVVIGSRTFGEGVSHSQLLLPTTIDLMEEHDVRIGDVDLFASVIGPGSFTGLRVSLANVRGLAGARPCFGAIATDVLAFAARDRGGSIVALIDLFHGEVFGALHDAQGGLVSPRVAGLPDAVIEKLGVHNGPTPVFTGSAAIRHRESIAKRFPGASFFELEGGLAPHLARFASATATDSTVCVADDLLPFYLRDPVNPGLKLGAPKSK